ncbi:MAG: phosphatase PAP2 family protein [Bacillota bacterium]|nr:phosphatase PAP2 family protein [Bacillota bacterium]HOC06337.1 phosphatase PAP2 family protein [Bacillota bacterium]HPZ21751.1 phosphatase PAP2 family protein [Bacillota bacterium]HQD19202.1 phosphatase PAP2 family protein [Bacillota bacterium]
MLDTTFITWVQQFSTPLLDGFFKAVTFLGDAEYYILVIPLLLWLYDKKFALRFGVFFLGNAWINSFLKHIFQIVRPPVSLHKIEQGGYSFPSGHAQGSTSFWGYLAVQIKRPWAFVVAAILSLLVAFSRVYLGVHFPHDILAGILIGIIWIVLYEFLYRKIKIKFSLWQWFLASLALCAVMLLLHPVGDGPLAAGFLLSALWGYRLEADYVRFNVKGHWWQNVIKASLGIAVLFALHSGLKPILLSLFANPLEATPLYYTATFCRYFILGWWVALLAPLCFKALRLYRRDS